MDYMSCQLRLIIYNSERNFLKDPFDEEAIPSQYTTPKSKSCHLALPEDGLH